MRLDYLDEFITLFEMLSFTRAAASLHMSQSVLSRHIRSMEEELGTSLFERDQHKVLPTREGELLYEHAAPITRLYGDFLDTLKNSHGPVHDHIRVSYIAGGCAPFMKDAYREFFKRLPHIELHLKTIEYKNSFHELFQDKADLLFSLITEPFEWGDLSYQTIYDDYFCACVTNRHAFAEKSGISLSELKETDFKILNFESNSMLSKQLANQLRDNGVFNAPSLSVPSADSIPIAAPPKNDHDCTIMVHQLINIFDDVGDYKFIRIEDSPVVHVSAIWKNRSENPSILEFVSLCQEIASNIATKAN